VRLDDLAPQPLAADDRVVVASAPCQRRQRIDPRGVAAAEHDVVGDARVTQDRNRIGHRALPLLAAQSLEAGPPDGLCNRSAHSDGRTPSSSGTATRSVTSAEPIARSEPEEEHTTIFVGAERLHHCVVDDPSGPAERRLEIESYPAGSKVAGFRYRMSVNDLCMANSKIRMHCLSVSRSW